MVDIRGLIRRGLNRPAKIPRYVLGALLPSSNWGATWRKRDGVVCFEPGGYATSPRTRPEFAANLYHEVAGFRDLCTTHLETPVDRSLEVGCGYGRLSPWIAEFSTAHCAVDPDAEAVAVAAEAYPWIAFEIGRAGALPCADDAFDLAVTWTVLEHVDDERIANATAELRRALAPGGLVVCCERIEGHADDHLHPRSLDRYRELFAPLELVDVRERPAEPTWAAAMPSSRPPERLFAFADRR